MGKPASSCIFCGGTGLTKEHIWPDWMRGYIPRANHSKVGHHEIVRFPDPFITSNPQRSKGSLARPGDTASKRLRCVCGTCNNGWMSHLQTVNKPLLTSLLEGKWPANAFTTSAIEHLAAWITMFSIVVEYADPDTAMVSEAERRRFFKTKLPDNHWRLYLGRGLLIHNQRSFWHRAVAFGPQRSIVKKTKGAITIAAFGQLFFMSLYTETETQFEPAPWLDLRTIWPAPPALTAPHFELNDYGYEQVMHSTMELLNEANAR